MKNIFLPFLLEISFFSGALLAQSNDERLVLGVYTRSVADVTELAKTKPPKIGVAYFGKDPGCDLELATNDVITHVDRDVVKSPNDFNTAIEGLDPEKKHKLTYQRLANGKWNKGEVAFKPKAYRQLVMDGLVESRDDINDATIIRDKRSPDSPDSTNLQCRLFSDKSGDRLLIRYSYNGKNWLFIESCTLKVDDENTEIKLIDVKRDNKSEVWEWSIHIATPAEHELLLKIATAKSVTIRFHGRQYKHDYELTGAEQRAIQNVLEAYRLRKK